MTDSKKQLDQVWVQIENAKKELTKILIMGLSDKDPSEVLWASLKTSFF